MRRGLGERSKGLFLIMASATCRSARGHARTGGFDLRTQKKIGTTRSHRSAGDSQKYMEGLFSDWQAKGITSVLHEKKGGYANNTASIYGLASKAEAEGVRIMTGCEVTGFEFGNNSAAVTGIKTNKGTIKCDYVGRRRRPLGQHDLEHA